jgi:cobalt-zinc-cadmium efflux system outer membrane protein
MGSFLINGFAPRLTAAGFILLALLPRETTANDRPAREMRDTAAANGASEESIIVTWSDIVAGVERHPLVAAEDGRLAAAKGALAGAGAIPNPSIDAALGRATALEGGESRPAREFVITFPLGWLVRRGQRVDAASALLEAAAAEKALARREALKQLHELFWTLVFDQAHTAELEAFSAQTNDLARLIGRRVDAGEARPAELARFEIEADRASIELESALAELAASRARLAAWLGIAQSEKLKARGELASALEPRDTGMIPTPKMSSHPLLTAGRARVRALQADVNAEKWARVPELSVRGFSSRELDGRTYGGGISLDIPLFNRNGGRIEQAKGALAAGRKELEADSREVEAATLAALAAGTQAYEAARRYRERILPRAERIAEIADRSFRLGEVTLLEVIDARRTLGESKRDYLKFLLRARLESGRLAILLGKDGVDL